MSHLVHIVAFRGQGPWVLETSVIEDFQVVIVHCRYHLCLNLQILPAALVLNDWRNSWTSLNNYQNF